MNCFKLYIILLFSPVVVLAQDNFEGSITYGNLSDSSLEGYTIYYGKNKIKLIDWNRDLQGKILLRDYYIYDFTTGEFINVLMREKKALVDSILGTSTSELIGERVPGSTENAQINNYPASKYIYVTNDSIDKILLQTESWFSDKIQFIIPIQFWNRHGLYASTTGNILSLQTSYKFDLKMPEMDTLLTADLSTIAIAKVESQSEKAVPKDDLSIYGILEIKPGPINDSIFAIPTGFSIVHEKIPAIQCTTVSLRLDDSDRFEPPPPPPRPPGHKRPGTKQEAKSKNP